MIEGEEKHVNNQEKCLQASTVGIEIKRPMYTIGMSAYVCTSHTSNVDYPKMVNPSCCTCYREGSFVFVF